MSENPTIADKKETEHRRDEALRRALATPPKRHKDEGDHKPSPKPKRDDAKASDRR